MDGPGWICEGTHDSGSSGTPMLLDVFDPQILHVRCGRLPQPDLKKRQD
ncbi:hypothetical protein BDA96_09G054100 [Sorghum bicolor]|uniref:Uncharacterized protein n=2 Tax=Sorghum bicolor TaxID=4558 RepID=A0A921Q9U9_SORBI|nr:hypothetical protein BDA96_09G054100 [Sorghum bicolor]OQU77463.1 hypothetical protein SORBI_3009G051001 [Sorghum bicolor]